MFSDQGGEPEQETPGEPITGDQGAQVDPNAPHDAPLAPSQDTPVSTSAPDPSSGSGIPNIPENADLIAKEQARAAAEAEGEQDGEGEESAE